MVTIFKITISTRIQNDLYAFKINSSDILFHSPTIAVLSEPIFGWEDVFVLFSKTPHKSCLIAVIIVFSGTFSSLACFLIDIGRSFYITVARAVKSLLFVSCSILHPPFSLKRHFPVKCFALLCILYAKKIGFNIKQIMDSLSFLFSFSLILSWILILKSH